MNPNGGVSGGDRMAGNGLRATAPGLTEVAYVRRDSFWIEHDASFSDVPIEAGTGPDVTRQTAGDGSRATSGQASAPMILKNSVGGFVGAALDDRRQNAHGASLLAGDRAQFSSGSRLWARFSPPFIVALAAAAFALGILVAPLARSSRLPADAPVTVGGTALPVAAQQVVPVTPPENPPSPTPVAGVSAASAARALPSDDGARTDVKPAPAMHAPARTAARMRTPPVGGNGELSSSSAWSSWLLQRRPTVSEPAPPRDAIATPDDPESPTGKSSDKQPDRATKKEGGAGDTPAKKTAPKPWVDPWAANVGLAGDGPVSAFL